MPAAAHPSAHFSWMVKLGNGLGERRKRPSDERKASVGRWTCTVTHGHSWHTDEHVSAAVACSSGADCSPRRARGTGVSGPCVQGSLCFYILGAIGLGQADSRSLGGCRLSELGGFPRSLCALVLAFASACDRVRSPRYR